MRHLSITEARKRLSELLDRPDGTIITRHGKPVKAMIDYDLYRAMQMDLELLEDPARDEILDAHARVQRGELDDFEDLDDVPAPSGTE